jgi:hypothetical protein
MIKKNIIWIILLILIWIVLFFGLWNFGSKKQILEEPIILKEKLVDNKHNWIVISKLLNINNYDKVWINPEEYESFWNFLEDFKSFTWVEVDPITENFTIWIEKDNWNILYIPFRFQRDEELFDDKDNKNLAILDIYSAYKNEKC